MFEAKLSDAKIFKECVDAIVTLIDEGEFSATNEGITLRAMDPSQIAMVDFELPKKAFEKYDLRGDLKIGLNLADLSRIMSRVRPGESITLKLDESASRLLLVFKGKSTRRFNLPLIDVPATVTKVPSIDFDAEVKINGGVLKESLKDASLVSSHVSLYANSEDFVIKAHSDKEAVVEFKKEALLEHTVNKEAKAMFPLEYLNDLLKAVDSNGIVVLSLKTDAPLKVDYRIADARVTYYLAPRIEAD